MKKEMATCKNIKKDGKECRKKFEYTHRIIDSRNRIKFCPDCLRDNRKARYTRYMKKKKLEKLNSSNYQKVGK